MITDKDITFMRRALELAENGAGKVSPNPMVGCVIVYDDEIIGEGWHMQYGASHAEVNAINAVKDKNLFPGSTAYVSLEPCSHFGKTPPCADLLVSHKIKRVVICNADPNPLVAGRGVERLKQSGAEVETGILEAEGAALNKRYFCFQHNKRPYVILKWAQTADGFIARENYDSKWISNQYSRQLAHRWRGEEDAILVGKNTAQYDNPKLNVRNATGKDPIRLALDSRLELSKTLSLFDETQLTICYNSVKTELLPNLEYVKVDPGAILEDMLDDLYERNVQSLIVEGGSRLINSFIEKKLWDEARVFKCPKTFGNGIAAPVLKGGVMNDVHNILDDHLEIYTRITNG